MQIIKSKSRKINTVYTYNILHKLIDWKFNIESELNGVHNSLYELRRKLMEITNYYLQKNLTWSHFKINFLLLILNEERWNITKPQTKILRIYSNSKTRFFTFWNTYYRGKFSDFSDSVSMRYLTSRWSPDGLYFLVYTGPINFFRESGEHARKL